MATTTNYGWTTPDDTDLVRNGADAIRVLGSSIDTTLYNAVGTGVGLVLIDTTDFTSVASVSRDNVFSATYDYYRIILTGTISTSVQDMSFRLRVGGTNNTTASSYVSQILTGQATSVAALRTTSDKLTLGAWDTTLVNAFTIDVFNPFKNTPTGFNSHLLRSSSNAYIQMGVGTHNQTVSYDGISVIPAANNITGTISIFGYAK
jgi:hypothetical protein